MSVKGLVDETTNIHRAFFKNAASKVAKRMKSIGYEMETIKQVT